jgi:integrase
MARDLLQDVAIKSAKSSIKDYRLTDGDGLYLIVKTTGAKWWRFDYTFKGKRKTLSLGTYPDTGLKSARRKASDARSLVADNFDPSQVRKEDKKDSKQDHENTARLKAGLPIIGSFAELTNQWLQSIVHLTTETTHLKKTSRIERLAFPVLRDKPISEIKSADVLTVLKPIIAKHQLETAHRLHSEISSIFDYAIAHGYIEFNQAQPVAKLIPAQKVKHRAAIIDPKKVGQLLRDMYGYQGTYVVQMALRLSPLLFQRPGEIRQMLWTDIDFDAKEWRPYISKTDFHHIVPLSCQALEILNDIKKLTGNNTFVFPSSRGNGRPMSDNAIRTALLNLGYDSTIQTAHGLRTIASTLLNEQGWSADAIERQLAHAPRDAVRAAYNRAQYLDERRRMMQSWADYIDSLRQGAAVVNIKKVS